MISPDATIKDVMAMDGVKDLPIAVRAKFIRALLLEAKGQPAEAEAALNEAVAAETALKAAA